MSSISLIFPHQLYEENPLFDSDADFYLVEEWLFFKQYKFHKQKIAYHRASMKFYAQFLTDKKYKVHYIEAQDAHSDIRNLIPYLKERGIKKINYVDPTDNWLEKRLEKAAEKSSIALNQMESPLFINSRKDNRAFFKADKKKFFQTKFYIESRKKRGILLDKKERPIGGKWSFDKENRKKYPPKKQAPSVQFPSKNDFHQEAYKYVAKHFDKNPGTLSKEPVYPSDFSAAKHWFLQFLETRFHEFGTYEDAIVANESILNHSVLSPMLNIGLLSPEYIITEALKFTNENNVPLNSTEGFVRQITGWREFIRGIYECKGTEERNRNFWGFNRKIPSEFYDGSTGITPVDNTINKVLKTGYCHHIERLMILGNFMVLCEFDPDEVYRWFMELFIDAYDWVMVPNIYGMSQFADGGLMSTKPYISGSNYILKMSDYKKGDWQETWDGLFWRFMHIHRDFFSKNPRLNMLLATFDKMDKSKQQKHLKKADEYLSLLKKT